MNLPSIPATLPSREYLRIGGGYAAPAAGASPAGGLSVDNAGNCALDGDLIVDGDASFAGELQTPNLHNNGGASAAAAIASGSYTPAGTNEANCASITGLTEVCWLRVGQVVNVTMRVGVNPTAGSTLTKLRLTLPIASDLTSGAHLAGSGCILIGASLAGVMISGDIINNAALLQFVSISTATHWIFCTFQYEIR